MLFDDTYKTISSVSEGTFRDRGSKFIAYLFPVRTEEEIRALLSTLRNEHPKARHFCWALRLSPDRSVFRINDDGEPSGSAGRPILNALLSAGVTNILAVVVRYFGGTLLGVPGLINAYKTATAEALAQATVIQKTVEDVYRIEFPYQRMNEVMSLLKNNHLPLERQLFDNLCSLETSIRKAEVNRMLGLLDKLDGVKALYLRTV